MKHSLSFAAVALGLALGMPSEVAAKSKPKVSPEQIAEWASCSVAKNGSEVLWLYLVETGQSGLKGQSVYGADAHGLFAMTRDCVPEGTSFDQKLSEAVTKKTYAVWGQKLDVASTPRAVDPFADCMVEHHRDLAGGYLLAQDLGFAGGPVVKLEGADANTAIFESTAECDALRPASESEIDKTDLYARLNYLIRLKPLVEVSLAAAREGAH